MDKKIDKLRINNVLKTRNRSKLSRNGSKTEERTTATLSSQLSSEYLICCRMLEYFA